jgi:hypothetical protein
MAALGNGVLTLLDWAKRLEPRGGVTSDIIELLTQNNEFLEDMTWREGNLTTGHRTTVRTGLPAVAWRLINQGSATSHSTTAQIDEQCGMLEAWSEIDVKLAKLENDVAALRLSEGRPFIEAMNQELAQTVFYGNSGLAPEEFTGLSPRYSDTTAGNGQNIILSSAGAGGDNTSIWLVAWHDETITGIFPKGSSAGLVHEDLGIETVESVAGFGTSTARRLRAYRDIWSWDAGIALKDWRYVVRIANIDVSDVNAGTVDLVNLVERALTIIPTQMGRWCLYMNRTSLRGIQRNFREDVTAGGGLNYDNVGGKRVRFWPDSQIPLRVVDAITNAETAVA